MLCAGVLGHVHDEHIVLSAALGGASVCRKTPTQLGASVAPRRGPAADWRRASPPRDEAQHAYLFVDGASRNNPGTAAGGCAFQASNGIETLVQAGDQ